MPSLIAEEIEAQKFKSEAYLRNAVGSVPDHLSKTNVTIKQVTQIHTHFFFCFPVHIKIMLTLFHSRLSF